MSNEELESEPVAVDSWDCAKCGKEFIDPEVYPFPNVSPETPREPCLYWLGITEPVCSDCAIESGIPPIDEEDE